MTYCWVVPHYNHSQEFCRFLPELIATGLPGIVVDDGSGTDELARIERALAENEGFELVRHTHNRGKGAAVITAAYLACVRGYTHIIQIDADGQHAASDVARFIAASQNEPEAIISGLPLFDESAPSIRKHGRKVTTFWVCLETLSLQIKDALCGYRVYPLQCIEILIDRFHIGPRMDFDTDIVVKAVWAGIPLHFLETRVSYHEDGRSHFHYRRDNLRLISLHVRLLLQAIRYLPASVWKRVQST